MYLVYLDTPARRRDAEQVTRMSAPHDPAYHNPVVHRDHLPLLKLQVGKYGVGPGKSPGLTFMRAWLKKDVRWQFSAAAVARASTE
jgi:hypothetical protein